MESRTASRKVDIFLKLTCALVDPFSGDFNSSLLGLGIEHQPGMCSKFLSCLKGKFCFGNKVPIVAPKKKINKKIENEISKEVGPQTEVVKNGQQKNDISGPSGIDGIPKETSLAANTTLQKTLAANTTLQKTLAANTTAQQTSTANTTAQQTSTVNTTAQQTSTVNTTAQQTSTVNTTAQQTSTVNTTAQQSSTVNTTAQQTSTVNTTAQETPTARGAGQPTETVTENIQQTEVTDELSKPTENPQGTSSNENGSNGTPTTETKKNTYQEMKKFLQEHKEKEIKIADPTSSFVNEGLIAYLKAVKEGLNRDINCERFLKLREDLPPQFTTADINAFEARQFGFS